MTPKTLLILFGLWLLHFAACAFLFVRAFTTGLARHHGSEVDALSAAQEVALYVLGLPFSAIVHATGLEITSFGLLLSCGMANSAFWVGVVYLGLCLVWRHFHARAA